MRRTTIAAATMLMAANTVHAAETFRIGLFDDPGLLDTDLQNQLVVTTVMQFACDKLFEVDEAQNLISRLATKYEWNDSNTVLTISLRDGVLFQDGTKFDAEAVKTNIERSATITGSILSAELRVVDRVIAKGPLEVEITLKEPDVTFLSKLAARPGMMKSPRQLTEMGERFGLNPVCVGPYKFIKRVPQGALYFERDPTYWDAGSYSIDKVEMLPVKDSAVRLANIRSGEFDIVERMSPSDIPSIGKGDGLQVVGIPELGFGYYQFNVDNGPKSVPVEIRKAFELALDRNTLAKAAFGDGFRGGDQLIAFGSQMYDEQQPPLQRDVERAKQLVQASGWKQPIEILVRSERDAQVPAQIMQAMGREAGLDLSIKTVDTGSTSSFLRSGDFGIFLSYWGGRIEPYDNIAGLFACDGYANVSRGKYCSEALDAMLKKIKSQHNADERKELYKKVSNMLREDAPGGALWYGTQYFITRDNVTGFTPAWDGTIRLKGVSLK